MFYTTEIFIWKIEVRIFSTISFGILTYCVLLGELRLEEDVGLVAPLLLLIYLDCQYFLQPLDLWWCLQLDPGLHPVEMAVSDMGP